MKIPIYLVATLTGLPADSLTFAGAELEVSLDGGAWQAPGGTVLEVDGAGLGGGLYVYSPNDTEKLARTFALRVVKSGVDPYGFETVLPMPEDIAAASDDPARRRVYLFVETDDANKTPITGVAAPSSGQLQVSVDGGAWADGLGAWTEIGDGYYTYGLSNVDVASSWLAIVKCTVGFQAVRWIVVGTEVAPAPVPPAPIPVPIPSDSALYVDHVALVLERLPYQFRSST